MTQRRIYQEEYPYFITLRTMEGCPLFEKTKYTALLAREIFISANIKYFDVLSYQIMPDHVHLLTCKTDRTLENVRSVAGVWSEFKKYNFLISDELVVCSSQNHPQSTLSRVRLNKNAQSRPTKIYTISDLMQSIKGNFSRKIHHGNIWQRRFYHRIVNTDEYLAMVIDYIKNNPTKENLPIKFQRVPYQYFDWPKINALF